MWCDEPRCNTKRYTGVAHGKRGRKASDRHPHRRYPSALSSAVSRCQRCSGEARSGTKRRMTTRTRKRTGLVTRTPPVPDSRIFHSRHGAHYSILLCVQQSLTTVFAPLSVCACRSLESDKVHTRCAKANQSRNKLGLLELARLGTNGPSPDPTFKLRRGLLHLRLRSCACPPCFNGKILRGQTQQQIWATKGGNHIYSLDVFYWRKPLILGHSQILRAFVYSSLSSWF